MDTPSSEKEESPESMEQQEPILFVQRWIFREMASMGKSLEEIQSRLNEMVTSKIPTLKTLRNWKKKFDKGVFHIKDKRAGRVIVRSKMNKRTAAHFKKSGCSSIY